MWRSVPILRGFKVGRSRGTSSSGHSIPPIEKEGQLAHQHADPFEVVYDLQEQIYVCRPKPCCILGKSLGVMQRHSRSGFFCNR